MTQTQRETETKRDRPVREARATRVSDHSGLPDASSISAALAPSKSQMSRSALGDRRSW